MIAIPLRQSHRRIGRNARGRATGSLFLIGALLAMSSGCNQAEPRYVKNWAQVRPGMTKAEITQLLGDSSLRSGPAEPAIESEDLTEAAPAWVHDLKYERWDYGQASVDNLLQPAPGAFVVYFDRQGKLVKHRGPLVDTRPSDKTSK